MGHVRVQVDRRGGYLRVPEPEGDDGDAVAGEQQAHRGGVAQGVHRDPLGSQRRARLLCGLDVLGEAP
ncbi:MAG: hypothetical protein M3O55_04020, partial [Actinomycetota bacterium]|nr:hypothetical protein [Actinomycetota bacterium]